MWKCILAWGVTAVMAFVAFVVPAAAQDGKAASDGTTRVLIVTGEDYKGHLWQQTTPALVAQLEKDARLRVDVLDDLARLADRPLGDYDVVVMHFENYDPKVPGRAGYDNLAKYVADGGGLVLVHFACGAFQEFKGDFVKLGGRAWNPELRGHDKRGPFTVKIVKDDHPITEGLGDFETDDELYTCLEGETPITLLATARSNVDHKDHPMAFVLGYGKGRVFHSPLGHDAPAFEVDAVGELFRRGCAWAAGIDATDRTKARANP